MTKPIYIRDDGTCGPAALKLIEDMARDAKSIGSIAKVLGCSQRKLKTIFERQKGENPERLAWESGRADHEQEFIDRMVGAIMGSVTYEEVIDEKTGMPALDGDGKPMLEKVRIVSKAAAIQGMFYAKAQLGWKEKDDGPVFQDNRINISLPDSLSREEMFKRLGIDAPLDFRKIKNVTPPEPLALPSPEKKS